MPLIVGAVNGIPASRNVQTAGTDLVTIPITNNGVATTLDVNTDGHGYSAATGGRVATIGGLVAGVDHTPLSWVTSTGVPDRYQVAVDKYDLCEMYWRVKKWHVFGSANYHVGMSDFPYCFRS